MHMPQKGVSTTTTHVTLNTVNGVVVIHRFPFFYLINMDFDINLLGVAQFVSLVPHHLLIVFTSSELVLHQQTYDETSTRTVWTIEPSLVLIMVIGSAYLSTP